MHPIALIRYLLLPLRTAPLLLIFILSVLFTFAVNAGVFGIPIFAIFGSWFFKYGFAFLDHVIEGHRDPPILSYEMANPIEQRPLGLLLLLVIFYSVTGALDGWLGHTTVTALRIALLALVPSIVASMSATGSFIGGLNPINVIGTILRIPIAYGLLLIIIGALWFIPLWLMRATSNTLASLWSMESFLPWQVFGTTGFQGVLFVGFDAMLFMYLWLAMFACIGGTLYERRQELEMEAAASPERIAARADSELNRQRDKTMDRIFAEARSGAYANAGASVRNLVENAQNPLDECRWLYARAAAATNQHLADYLAQLTLPRLLSVRASSEALKLLRDRLNVNADFKPETSTQLLQLARLARDAGDRTTARRLLANFAHFFPDNELAEAIAILASELER